MPSKRNVGVPAGAGEHLRRGQPQQLGQVVEHDVGPTVGQRLGLSRGGPPRRPARSRRPGRPAPRRWRPRTTIARAGDDPQQLGRLEVRCPAPACRPGPNVRASTPVTRTSKRSSSPARASSAVQFSLADTTASPLARGAQRIEQRHRVGEDLDTVRGELLGEVARSCGCRARSTSAVRRIVRRPDGPGGSRGRPGRPRPRRSAAGRPRGPGSRDRGRTARKGPPSRRGPVGQELVEQPLPRRRVQGRGPGDHPVEVEQHGVVALPDRGRRSRSPRHAGCWRPAVRPGGPSRPASSRW